MTPLMLVGAGLVLLVAGAELLVRGASGIARSLGISPLIIGLTVVAYGTSAPELAVSLRAAFAGQADIALGNVVGSNIFNVLFILGLSALIVPLVVSEQLVRLDVPVMVGVSVLVYLFGLDGSIGRLEGIVLFLGAVGYTAFLARKGQRERSLEETDGAPGRSRLLLGVLVLAGLALLGLGAGWLVDGAVDIAGRLGVSELVIGLTIVAAGTSLPEVAASVAASLRGERDLAVGNVVGSNIFNLLAILGLAAAVSPAGVAVSTAAQHFDMPVMLAVAVACLPVFFTGSVISRWEGLVFLAYYVAYATYLVLAATSHDALPAFSRTMLWFVLPLTLLTLLVISVREARTKWKRSGAI